MALSLSQERMNGFVTVGLSLQALTLFASMTLTEEELPALLELDGFLTFEEADNFVEVEANELQAPPEADVFTDETAGKGNNRFKHTQKSSHNNYTKSDPAQGLTVDAKKIKGQATIVYSIR